MTRRRTKQDDVVEEPTVADAPAGGLQTDDGGRPVMDDGGRPVRVEDAT